MCLKPDFHLLLLLFLKSVSNTVKMADAIVSFAVERVGALLISESKLLNGVHGQIKELQSDLKRMQNFFKEADKKHIQDERVRGWVDERVSQKLINLTSQKAK